MERKHESPKGDRTLPGWIPLLRELLEEFGAQMSDEDERSARRLLAPGDERPAARSLDEFIRGASSATTPAAALGWLEALGPTIGSRELILAASLIRKADPVAFDRRFREAVAEKPGQCSDTHLAILESSIGCTASERFT